uniref:Ovule protein n=1 Tax=Parascaris univalens TaxID=6257 RepID=A0A915BM69_PARUN
MIAASFIREHTTSIDSYFGHFQTIMYSNLYFSHKVTISLAQNLYFIKCETVSTRKKFPHHFRLFKS